MSIFDRLSLHGRTILLTGATGHLGRAMATALAQAGGHILINARTRSTCEKLVTSLQAAGGSAEMAAFDVRDADATARFFADRGTSPLHGLINNAYAGGAGTIETSDTQDYLDSCATTLGAAHSLFKQALPALRQGVRDAGDCSVINIASMYGVVSPDLRLYDDAKGTNPPFYGAAKAALLQWTRYAACEFGPEGIRVNAVSPGPFPSATVQQTQPAFVERLAQKVPLRRIGQAAEIQGLILLLASPASSYINGANIPVDGGWTSW